MPKRTSSKKLDDVQNARRVVLESIASLEEKPPETEVASEKSVVSKVMAEMGRKGGKIGGKRRLVTMTRSQRSRVARKAALARWRNRKKDKL
jgi:hypothetical protein